jgi:hypothetical protein
MTMKKWMRTHPVATRCLLSISLVFAALVLGIAYLACSPSPKVNKADQEMLVSFKAFMGAHYGKCQFTSEVVSAKAIPTSPSCLRALKEESERMVKTVHRLDYGDLKVEVTTFWYPARPTEPVPWYLCDSIAVPKPESEYADPVEEECASVAH